jgi:hypothetical protein
MEIGTSKGFIDFLTVYNIIELFDILYSQSYDRGDLPLRYELDFQEARHICHTILEWFHQNYEIVLGKAPTVAISPARVQRNYLSGLVRALLRYQALLDEESEEEFGDDVDGQKTSDTIEENNPSPKFKDLENMIRQKLDQGAEFILEYQQLLNTNPDDHYFSSFSWPPDECYVVSARKTNSQGKSYH